MTDKPKQNRIEDAVIPDPELTVEEAELCLSGLADFPIRRAFNVFVKLQRLVVQCRSDSESEPGSAPAEGDTDDVSP